jgi:putative DNA primase/helicase
MKNGVDTSTLSVRELQALKRAKYPYVSKPAEVRLRQASKRREKLSPEERAAEDREQAERTRQALPKQRPKPNAPPAIKPVPLGEFLKMNIQQRRWVLEGLIRERSTGMIYSWRGVGKTRFAQSMGLAIATGGAFLKWDAKGSQRGVLLVDGELTAPELQERLQSITQGEPPDNFKVLASDLHELGLPNLATPQGQKVIEAALDGVEVLILDNLSTLFRSGVENEAESWLPVQQWLLKLRRQGKTVIVIHHAGKGGEQRGTSRREDVLDLVLNLKRPDDYDPEEGACFEVRFEKARSLSGPDQLTFKAQLMADARGVPTWTWEPVEQSRKSEIAELHSEGKSVRQIAKELGLSKSAVQRAVANCPGVPPPKVVGQRDTPPKSGTPRGTAAGQPGANAYAATKNGE